jgi:hypothetical protein
LAVDVDPTLVEGRWLRHVPAGLDPSHRPILPADNRWQRGHVVDALYLASDEDGVWAEWYRHLAERAIPPHVALPRNLWSYEVTLMEVADLSHRDRLARVNLSPPRPGRGRWAAYQAVGEQLHREGWRGLLAASAARPTTRVLVVFLPEGVIPEDVVAVSARRIMEPPPPPSGMRT